MHKIKSRKYTKYQSLIRKIAYSDGIGKLPLLFIGSPGPVRFQEYPYAFAIIQRNKPLLDIGSGLSCFPNFVARSKGIDVVCVDLNIDAIRESLEISKKIHENVSSRMHYVFADAQNLPFKDASIAQISCISVLEHVADDRRSSAEIGRVLSSDGLCCITLRYSFIPRKHHYLEDGSFERFYTENDIRNRIVLGSGLDLKQFHLIDKRFSSILFRLRFINAQENPILSVLAKILDEIFLKTSKDAMGVVLTLQKCAWRTPEPLNRRN